MGHYSALYKGFPHYLLANLDTDALGQAGVACMGCHSIGDSLLGSLFSGNIPYDTTRHVFGTYAFPNEYGPFTAPQQGPMQLYVGLNPAYSLHMGEGRLCSSCHTLISNTVDTSGNPTGGTFVEPTQDQVLQTN